MFWLCNWQDAKLNVGNLLPTSQTCLSNLRRPHCQVLGCHFHPSSYRPATWITYPCIHLLINLTSIICPTAFSIDVFLLTLLSHFAAKPIICSTASPCHQIDCQLNRYQFNRQTVQHLSDYLHFHLITESPKFQLRSLAPFYYHETALEFSSSYFITQRRKGKD